MNRRLKRMITDIQLLADNLKLALEDLYLRETKPAFQKAERLFKKGYRISIHVDWEDEDDVVGEDFYVLEKRQEKISSIEVILADDLRPIKKESLHRHLKLAYRDAGGKIDREVMSYLRDLMEEAGEDINYS